MRKLPVILAVVFFTAARVEAESFVLVDLIADDGSIVQGDKLFDNFGVQVGNTFGFGFPLIGNIVVEGITRNGEHGLRFVGTWRAASQPEGGSGFGILLTFWAWASLRDALGAGGGADVNAAAAMRRE